MSRKGWSGLLGIIAGGAWLASNFQYFDEQGITAIGMPLLLIIIGGVFLVGELKK